MDGDGHQSKKYEGSYTTGNGMRQQRTMRQGSGSSAERFRHPGPSRRMTVDTSMPPQGGSATLSSYGGFEYTESPTYNTAPLQGGSLQSGELHYQTGFPPRNPSQATQQQPAEQEQQQRLPQYDTGVVYNMPPHAQPQSPYYQPRQSAAIEVLATQFGVPQYFASDEPTGGPGAPAQYLTQQDQSAAYPQPPPASRPGVATSYPENMTGFNAPSGPAALELQEAPRPESSTSVEESYNRYNQALRRTFQDVRNGRLSSASETLLEMSEWLLGNAVELGLARDQDELHADRINLWDEFNTCWLAVCQKQKDTTEAMLETGTQAPEILSQDTLQKLGQELVRLCDKMEQYGLVDYQMGVWEEEILCVLGQCLDLLEGSAAHTATRQT